MFHYYHYDYSTIIDGKYVQSWHTFLPDGAEIAIYVNAKNLEPPVVTIRHRSYFH